MPNPKRYVLVFVPSLEAQLAASESKLGRPMTPSERLELKSQAVVIALPPNVANELTPRPGETATPGAE